MQAVHRTYLPVAYVSQDSLTLWLGSGEDQPLVADLVRAQFALASRENVEFRVVTGDRGYGVQAVGELSDLQLEEAIELIADDGLDRGAEFGE